MRGTGALASFVGSVRLLRARTLMSLSLGGAVVLGLVASCCGVGAVIAPFFLCELLALQLGLARDADGGAPPARHSGWLGACVVLLGAVMLIASVGWLVGLGLGTESVATTDVARRMASQLALPDSSWLLVPLSALAAIVFVLPYLYAPLLLIEERQPVVEAMLESARLVRSAGVLSQLALSLGSHAVQVAPIVLGSLAAHTLAGPELGSLWALLALPLMVLTTPLGQGMIVSSFAAQGHARRPRKNPPLPRRARFALALWAVLIISPLVSFGMLGASLVRPARLSRGELPEGAELLATLEPTHGPLSTVLPATALTVRVTRRAVYVEASDGGGAGRLPLRSRALIDRVRIGRTRDRYAIAVEQGYRRNVTFVDRAGVRLDDDLRARLDDRLPAFALASMIGALLAIAAVQLPVLAAAGSAHRSREPLTAQSPAITRALTLGGMLLPLAIASLWFGLRALLGL